MSISSATWGCKQLCTICCAFHSHVKLLRQSCECLFVYSRFLATNGIMNAVPVGILRTLQLKSLDLFLYTLLAVITELLMVSSSPVRFSKSWLMKMFEVRSAAEAACVQVDESVLLHTENVSEVATIKLSINQNRYGPRRIWVITLTVAWQLFNIYISPVGRRDLMLRLLQLKLRS